MTGDGNDMMPEAPGVVAGIAPCPWAEPAPPGLMEVPDANEGLCDTTTLVMAGSSLQPSTTCDGRHSFVSK
jgi:hypothetical protein